MNWIIDETENEFIIKIKQLNLKKENFKLVRFDDYFEKIKPERTFTIRETNQNSGSIPLLSSTCRNNGIVKYITCYSIDLKEESLVINKNGSVGYCFVHSGKIAITTDVCVFKCLNKSINLRVSSILLTNQLRKQFNWSKKINDIRLKQLECYVYLNDTNDLSSEFKIVGVIPKLKIDKTKIRKIKFSDYFEKIKPERIFTLRETNQNSGSIPLLSSTCRNNGIVKYINCYSIDLKEESLVINKNGSVGYCFVHSGKIAITTDVCVFKCLNKSINLRVSSMFLTNQLRKQFNWSNKINDIRLKQLECYVYFN